MLTYHTAGESHGKGLLALVDGFPAGLEIQTETINYELARRQGGYGRGGRQRLETDTAEILTGIWGMKTIGSPIALWVKNRDYRLPDLPDLETARPGHGDLTGSRKFLSGMRAILERASARETAARVAAGGLARQLLSLLGIEAVGFVQQVGDVPLPVTAEAEELFDRLKEAGENGTDCAPIMAKIRKFRDENDLYALSAENAIEAGKARNCLFNLLSLELIISF